MKTPTHIKIALAAAVLSAALLFCAGRDSGGGGTFTDPRDGQAYRTVKIGGLTWMAQNLNFITDRSWWYDNGGIHLEKYGRLYTWDAAMSACPAGWRLPNNDDWDNLMQVAGGQLIPGGDDNSLKWAAVAGKLKSKTGWWVDDAYGHTVDDNYGHTDDFGFSALPGGKRDRYKNYDKAEYRGYWWSGTKSNTLVWYYEMSRPDSFVTRRSYYKSCLGWEQFNGFSVRCVKGKIKPPAPGVSGKSAVPEPAAEPIPKPAAEFVPEPVVESAANMGSDTAEDGDGETPPAPIDTAGLSHLIPAGYLLVEKITGDLNGDGLEDVVLIVRNTDKKNIFDCKSCYSEDGEKSDSFECGFCYYELSNDTNPWGIIIAFKKGNHYRRVLENRHFFSAELWPGGTYQPQEGPDVSIKEGNLLIENAFKASGLVTVETTYKFRYQNSDFELIGYDHARCRRDVYYSESINFLTKRMFIKKMPEDAEYDWEKLDNGEVELEEIWERFTIKNPILLRKVPDFRNFDVMERVSRSRKAPSPEAERINRLIKIFSSDNE